MMSRKYTGASGLHGANKIDGTFESKRKMTRVVIEYFYIYRNVDIFDSERLHAAKESSLIGTSMYISIEIYIFPSTLRINRFIRSI